MLDINYIKKIKDIVAKKLEAKKVDASKISKIIENNERLNKIKSLKEKLLADRNNKSNEIAKLSKAGDKKQVELIKSQVLELKKEIDKLGDEIEMLDNEIKNFLDVTPNICDDSVPIGKDENENVVIKKFLEPTKFNFEPKAHWDLADELKLFLPNVATKITGARFITYWNQGARLYRALQQFTLDHNIANGFIEVLPQSIVNKTSLYSSGQLPKFEEDLFKLQGDSEYYLSPTAEVQLTNIYRNEIIPLNELPIMLTANTPCFRSEAGSAGRDTRGAIRLHQFHKTELMAYTHPSKSFEMLEKITSIAEGVLEKLEIPYRRIVLCTGDTGFSSAKTYDIEVWLPSYNEYKEISSCSNCTDFQARRAKIRFKDEDGTNKLVHTLNGSSLAIDRLWVAVVENYQNKDGSITIPKALKPYMNNIDRIK